VLAGAQIVPGAASAAITQPFVPDGELTVAPGLTHQFGSMVVNHDGPRDVDVLKMAAQHPGLFIRLSQIDGMAITGGDVLDHAADYSQDGRRVVGTVNGSLFSGLRDSSGQLGLVGIGLNVSDGVIINAGTPRRRANPTPAFGVDGQGKAIIGSPETIMTLTLPSNHQVKVDRVNMRRSDDSVVLYTPLMGPHTWTDDAGDEYVIEGFSLPLAPTGSHTGTVVAVRRGNGETPIGPGQVVLSVSSTAPAWGSSLFVGDRVSFQISQPEAWRTVAQSIAGRDMLVDNGVSVVPLDDRDGAHHRTAIGITAGGGVVIMTAKGQNGITRKDAATTMLSLGAVKAMNFDGGGSSQMGVRLPGDREASMVTLKNSLGGYRLVANALQIVSNLPTGQLANLVVSPSKASVAPGAPIDFVAKGHDAAYNAVGPDPATLQWSVAPKNGGTAQAPTSKPTPTSARFVMGSPGDYVVTLRSGDLSATAELRVGDVNPPVVDGLNVSIAPLPSVGGRKAMLNVGWTATDDAGVTGVQLQRRIGTEMWRSVTLRSSTASSAAVELGFGDYVRFRVRAVDREGNWSQWLATPAYHLRLFNDTSAAVKFVGRWERRYNSSAINGQFVRTTVTGASAAVETTVIQMAVIGNRGPVGQAAVIVDGAQVATINLSAGSKLYRQVLYLTPLETSRTLMSMRLQDFSGQVEFDAFLVLTTE
jgi:hypothetical protein